MYPPSQAIASLILSTCFLMCLSKLYHVSFPTTLNIYGGIVSFVWFALLLRVMDEFKDYEDDLKNYPTRPLPSGRVLKSDLKVLAGIVVALIIGCNMMWKDQAVWAFITFGYCILMLKWFFIEKTIRKSLPLAFITHHPVAYIVLLYLAVCFQVATGLDAFTAKTLVIFPIVFGVTNWEFSRKIRGPKEESDYVTYSMIFGAKTAVAIALLCQLVTLVGAEIYFTCVNVPIWFRVLFGLLFLILWSPYFVFLKKMENGIKLKTWAEYIVILTQFSIILTYFIF